MFGNRSPRWRPRARPCTPNARGSTYLVDELDGHPMCGVLAGTARFTDKLTLGYRDAVAAADSSLYAEGTVPSATNSTAPQ